MLEFKTATENDLLGLSADPLPVVNCANGEIWLDENGTAELRPHKPESRLTYCLPVKYDPNAECAIYDKSLLEVFSKSSDPVEMVRHWHEFVGYSIQPRRDIPSFWLLIGHGANGKSKLLQTVQKLVGRDAVMNASIARFQRDRFNTAALPGKLLFIDDDVGIDTRLDDGLIKTDCLRAAREFLAHANPLVAFIEEHCIVNPEGHEFLSTFRTAMITWATEQGLRKAPPNKALKRQLEGLGFEVKLVGGYNRVNGLSLL